MPPETRFITNDPDAILFFLERPAYEINRESLGPPTEDFHRYGDNPDSGLERIFREEGAALVLFDRFYWELRPYYGEDTQHLLDALVEGLTLYASSRDGDIYFYNPIYP